MPLKNQKTKLLGTVATVLAAGVLGGCHSYLSRHEGITTHAGNTLAHNEAISVVDTWPDGFDDTDIPTDGSRQADAIKNYKTKLKQVPQELQTKQVTTEKAG